MIEEDIDFLDPSVDVLSMLEYNSPDWDYEIPLSEFFKAYRKCRKNKRSTANAIEFEFDYAIKLLFLCDDVNLGRYEIGKSICFLVKIPKLREVFAASFIDRVVHHVIMERLEPLFEAHFIDDNYNCRAKKGTLYGINRLAYKMELCSENYTKPCYVGKFDMKGFFMSIRKDILLEMLLDFINEKYTGGDIETLVYLVEKVVMNEPQNNCFIKGDRNEWSKLDKKKSLFTVPSYCGLPIGNLTSQCFANFYLSFFDNMMMKLYAGFYGRYVDDFYVISQDKNMVINAKEIASTYLEDNLHVTLHPDKVYIQEVKKGVKFIGAVVKPHRTYVGNQTVSNGIHAIGMWNSFSLEEKSHHVRDFLNSMNSYTGFLKHHSTINVLHKKFLVNINDEWYTYLEFDNENNKFRIKNAVKEMVVIRKMVKKRKKRFLKKNWSYILT